MQSASLPACLPACNGGCVPGTPPLSSGVALGRDWFSCSRCGPDRFCPWRARGVPQGTPEDEEDEEEGEGAGGGRDAAMSQDGDEGEGAATQDDAAARLLWPHRSATRGGPKGVQKERGQHCELMRVKGLGNQCSNRC